MVKRTDTLTYAVQMHIAEHHTDGTFCVLDMQHVATSRGEHAKGITHAMQSLVKKQLIERCGELRNPNGGAPINLYRIIDAEKIACQQPKKSCAEYQQETKQRLERMNMASLNLARAMGIGCHA